MKGSTADLLFDNGVEPPQRPPRKHQSSSSVTSGNSGQFNSLDRRGTRQSTSQNDLGQKWSVYPPLPPPQQHQQQQQPQHHQSSYRQQQPSTYKQQNRHAQQTTSLSRRDTTASTLPRRDVTSAALKRSDDRKYQSTSSFVLSPGSVSSGGGGSRHRSASRWISSLRITGFVVTTFIHSWTRKMAFRCLVQNRSLFGTHFVRPFLQKAERFREIWNGIVKVLCLSLNLHASSATKQSIFILLALVSVSLLWLVHENHCTCNCGQQWSQNHGVL